MKDYIIKSIKDSLEEQKKFWASMYVAKKFHEGKENAASKKEVKSAEFEMTKCEERQAFLEKLLAEESK